MYIKTTGLVLREVEYKESSRILTVLTSSEGKITVSARGAKRRGSKTAASTQLLSYSDMTLFHERGRYTLTEARSIELFRGLRDDLKRMSLGCYFAEALESLTDEDVPNPEMLSLGLNALYALSEEKRPAEIIKAVFELRLMCLSGFEPQAAFCPVCGREDMISPCLSLEGGVVHCAECSVEGESLHISRGTLDALRYIISADGKKIFSFSLDTENQKQLSRTCEAYLKAQLGRDFKTLDFYKSVL